MTISDRRREAERRPVSPAALRDPVHLFALGFGAGLSPVAPGTVGSLVGLGLALAIRPLGLAALAGAALLATVVGVRICGESARRLGVHDHPAIVWDEIAGMLIAMLAAPAEWWGPPAAFALFRAFDIVKPWPIREIDHGLRGGAGIILDDVLAGILAALGLVIVRSIA